MFSYRAGVKRVTEGAQAARHGRVEKGLRD
jgi:hypothetical protein